MVLSLSASGGRSSKPARHAVCRGQNRVAQVPTAKVCLHGVAGFLPVAAGAVPDLVFCEGGSLAGGCEPGDCGRQ